MALVPSQPTYSNVVIQEGSEPENFFWVALGGKAEYDTVSCAHTCYPLMALSLIPRLLFVERGRQPEYETAACS